MISRDKKGEIIAQMRDRLVAAQALVIAENAGLTAAQMAQLRINTKEVGGCASG